MIEAAPLVLPTPPAGGAGGIRVGLALDEDNALEAYPTWTYITAYPSLVTSYTIDRGRAFEFDKNDAGTCTISVLDRDGILDPTNTSGPFYGQLEPLVQVLVQLLNPLTGDYVTRFRGWVEDFDYAPDPSMRFSRLELECVDIFEILSAIEMQPDDVGAPTFGHPGGPPGQVFFDNTLGSAGDRAELVLDQAHIPSEFQQVFTLNVRQPESVYAPSASPMEVIQDTADAEFPTVANVYVDRKGVLCIHGRLSRFNPEDLHGGTDWDWRHWYCGDSLAVEADAAPNPTSQLRQLAFNRGRSKVYNYAFCTPMGLDDGLTDDAALAAKFAAQVVRDDASIGRFGFRSWSAENLLVSEGILTGLSGADECRAFAQYIVDNYGTPRDRVTLLGFRTVHETHPAASATWSLLTHCDIGDKVSITAHHFNMEPFFIEGVHEQVEPLNQYMANVTLTLDVSPVAWFNDGSAVLG